MWLLICLKSNYRQCTRQTLKCIINWALISFLYPCQIYTQYIMLVLQMRNHSCPCKNSSPSALPFFKLRRCCSLVVRNTPYTALHTLKLGDYAILFFYITSIPHLLAYFYLDHAAKRCIDVESKCDFNFKQKSDSSLAWPYIKLRT